MGTFKADLRYAPCMPVDEFIENCACYAFTRDDGIGFFSDAEGVFNDSDDNIADPEEVIKPGFTTLHTHVVWFNK